MVNMVDAAWTRGMAIAVRWLSVVALIVFVLGRVPSVSMRRAQPTWSVSAGGLPPVGQQLLDPVVQLHWQPGKDVLQVSPGLAPIELGRLQQAHHDSSALASQLTTDEQPVTPNMHICACSPLCEVRVYAKSRWGGLPEAIKVEVRSAVAAALDFT